MWSNGWARFVNPPDSDRFRPGFASGHQSPRSSQKKRRRKKLAVSLGDFQSKNQNVMRADNCRLRPSTVNVVI